MADGRDDEPRIAYGGGTLARFDLGWLARGEPTGDGGLPAWVDR